MDDTSDADTYIIGRFAQWAGDVDYAAKLYKDFAPSHEYRKIPDVVAGPIELMRYCAAVRRRQIVNRKRAFREFARHYRDKGLDLSHEPSMVLSGADVRATLWRTDERTLQLRAYPTSRRGVELIARNAALLQESREQPPDSAVGNKLIIGTDPFVSCTISLSCLIQGDAMWVRRETVDFQRLELALSGVLTVLAGQVATVSL